MFMFWLKHSFWFICFSTAVHFDLKLESNTTHIFVDAPSTEFVDVNLKKKACRIEKRRRMRKTKYTQINVYL